MDFLIPIFMWGVCIAVVLFSRYRWKISIGLPIFFISSGFLIMLASNLGLVSIGVSIDVLVIIAPIGFGFIALFFSIYQAKRRGIVVNLPKKKFQKSERENSSERPVNFNELTEKEKQVNPIKSPPNIFISYRRKDSQDITGRIYDRLIQKYSKFQVFKDVDSIPLGVDFRTHIDQKVSECDIVLVVIGDTWLNIINEHGQRRIEDPLDFVYLEIEAALRREIPVIPLLVKGATMPPPHELPLGIRPLAYRNGTPIRSDPDFHNDVSRLLRGLESHS